MLIKTEIYSPRQSGKICAKGTGEGESKKTPRVRTREGGKRGGEILKDMEISEILVNEKAQKKELSKLLKIFREAIKPAGADGKRRYTDKGPILENLVNEAAFVRCVLAEARAKIQDEGIETVTVNASQKFKKVTPAVQVYSDYLKTYTQLINSLIAHIPERQERKQARLAALMMDD